MHKSQVLFYIIIAFLGGVFVASFLAVSQTWILIFLILAISLIAVSGYQRTYSKKGLLVGVLALVFIFGVIRFNSFNLANSILNQFVGTEVTLNGYIDEEPDTNGLKSQFIFRVKELVVPDRMFEVNERTLIMTNSFPKHQFGDELSINGSLQIPHNFIPLEVRRPSKGSSADHASEASRTSNGIDYVQYLKNKDIRTVMSFPKIQDNPELALGFGAWLKISLYSKLFKVKELFESSVNHSLPEPYAAYINGILLGSRQNIPQSIKDAFNKTSTTHILAISGYNITIIADALLTVLVLTMRRRRAFWVSVVVILLFTILTGASASVVRAATMGLLLLFANGYGRLYDARNGIALAAGLMVFLNPFVLVFDIGFQLSFLAVLGLIYFYPILDKKFNKLADMAGLKESLLMTVSAQTLVFPLIIYYFHQFSLVSLPANIFVLPFMPLTMLFGFLTGVGGMIFAPLGRAVGLFAWGLGYYQLGMIKWFGSLSFAAISIAINWTMLLVVYSFIVYGIWKLSRAK